MNTYSVVYFPSATGSSPSVVATVQAFEFVIEEGFIVFIDSKNHALFAVPVALNPVVTQTAAA